MQKKNFVGRIKKSLNLARLKLFLRKQNEIKSGKAETLFALFPQMSVQRAFMGALEASVSKPQDEENNTGTKRN